MRFYGRNLADVEYLLEIHWFTMSTFRNSFCAYIITFITEIDDDFIHRWQGSIYKILWKEVLIYFLSYILLGVIYKFVLDGDAKA